MILDTPCLHLNLSLYNLPFKSAAPRDTSRPLQAGKLPRRKGHGPSTQGFQQASTSVEQVIGKFNHPTVGNRKRALRQNASHCLVLTAGTKPASVQDSRRSGRSANTSLAMD